MRLSRRVPHEYIRREPETRSMKKIAAVLTIAVALSTVAACASTSVRDSWTAPDVQGPLDYDKVLVVFMTDRESTRRAAEGAMVNRVGNAEAVASFTLFTTEQVRNAEGNENAIRQRLRSEGIDAAIVMRLVDEKEQLNYSAGMTYPTPYRGFYGFYGYGWGMAYSPGYMSSSTIVSVETSVYDLDADKLVYSGLTETVDPSEVARLVNDIADAVTNDLRSKGLID
jgi:hypothetical protein